MTRIVSAAVATAIAQPVTGPGYLVEIGFSTWVRLSSRGSLDVLGNHWSAWGLGITGIGVDATSAIQSGTLNIANTDLTMSTLILTEGISDKAINIYKFYGEHPADADVTMLFSGVGGEATIDTNSGMVSLKLRQARDSVQFAPAKYITVDQGFSMLPPAGTVIEFGGQTYVLRPEAY